MPAVKPPTVHQCGTQWAVKRHGVVWDKEANDHAWTTLCGREVRAATTRRFDPASEDSCHRCVLSFNKRYADERGRWGETRLRTQTLPALSPHHSRTSMGKSKIEYRVVAADGRNRYHAPDRDKAIRAAEQLNQTMIDNLARGDYPRAHQQYPWRVEKRTVGEWEKEKT